jgi:aspartyl-tRNA(Asn)/glutamyl-tRNA(Gln) amidotransferase subunit B
MASPQEAREFLDQLTTILSYLEVFDFENGTLKADCNLSIKGSERVEIKNVTGKRNVEKALEAEAKRQISAIKQGQKIAMETRAFDEASFSTRSLRKKETEDDYGYITDTDLTSFELTKQEIDALKKALPELHFEKAKRLVKEFGISEYDAKVISGSKFAGSLFEEFAKKVPAKIAAVFVSRDLVSIAHYEEKELEEIADRLNKAQLPMLPREQILLISSKRTIYSGILLQGALKRLLKKSFPQTQRLLLI